MASCTSNISCICYKRSCICDPKYRLEEISDIWRVFGIPHISRALEFKYFFICRKIPNATNAKVEAFHGIYVIRHLSIPVRWTKELTVAYQVAWHVPSDENTFHSRTCHAALLKAHQITTRTTLNMRRHVHFLERKTETLPQR